MFSMLPHTGYVDSAGERREGVLFELFVASLFSFSFFVTSTLKERGEVLCVELAYDSLENNASISRLTRE